MAKAASLGGLFLFLRLYFPQTNHAGPDTRAKPQNYTDDLLIMAFMPARVATVPADSAAG
jgi:hypothetical protein